MTTKQISGKQALLIWVQRSTEGYPNVSVTNFSESFRDGLVFCAIIHRHRPDLINFKSLSASSPASNHALAFQTGERLGIPVLLDVEDMLISKPEPHSVMTYTSMMYHFFTSGSARGGGIGVIKANADMPPSTLSHQRTSGAAPSSSSSSPSPSSASSASKPTWASLDEVCARCNKPLSGSVAKNKGKVFHASCFTCSTCSTQLRGRCINIENNAYCEKCGKVAFSKASSSSPAADKSSPLPQRRLSVSMANQPSAEERDAEDKRKRIEKQRERIEEEKNKLAQEAARKEEAEREAREQKARKEREEREESMRREHQERARKEQELKEKEAQERLERVRREREQMEREAKAKEEREERERQELLRQERQKREEEARERQEREQKLRERKAEEERLEAAAREKEAAARAAKNTSPAPRGSTAASSPATKSETDGMTEWQRIAFEKAKKRSAAEDTAAASPQVSNPPSPRSSAASKSPTSKTAVASRHGSAAPKPSDGPASRRGSAAPKPSESGTAEWQKKAADMKNKLAAAVEVAKPDPIVVEAPKPIVSRPPTSVKASQRKGSTSGEEDSSEESTKRVSVIQQATVVTAEAVEIAVATPMRPSLPPARPLSKVPAPAAEEEPKSPRARPKSPVPEVPVVSVLDDTPRSPRGSPRGTRYSVRPPPPVPAVDSSLLKFASFGVSISDIMRNQAAAFPHEKLPRVWTTLVRLLHKLNGLEQEGIFRMSGSSSDIDRLKETLNKGAFDAEYDGDAHVVACAMKQWIAELSEPLIPRRVYEETIAAVEVPGGDSAVMPYIYQSLRELPQANRDLLLAFVSLMREVLSCAASNRMNEANLAICFSPGIFQSLADDPARFVHNSQCETKWVELLIRFPPKEEDLVRQAGDHRLVAPARDLSVSMGTPAAKRRGSYLGGKGSNSAPNMVVGGAAKTAQLSIPSSSPSTFDTIFQASNTGGVAGLDGSLEAVANYIVKGETLQGYLMKENPNGIPKMWKRRWFVLQGKRLLYYAEPRPGRPAGEGLKGFIPLSRATVSASPGYAKKDFALVINTPERSFYLQAADAQDLYYWISSLHDVLESAEMQAPESEYTTSAPDAALLPAREYSFAKDAFAGELERLGPLKMWKKRHIVLSDGILYAFKKNGDRKPSEKVFLYGSHLEEHDADLQKSEQCIAFRVRAATGSDIVLRASSPEVMAGWTNAILRHRLAISEQIEGIVV